MMADDLSTDHDVIVVGTGVPESIVAAAAARIGQRVLHLDREAHYGSLWASYNFHSLREWIFERQGAVPRSQSLDAATVEALLRPGESIYEAPQHYASVTNPKEIFNMPETLPEVKDGSSDSQQTAEPSERGPGTDSSTESVPPVPPGSVDSHQDTNSSVSSAGGLLPSSSSAETGAEVIAADTREDTEQRFQDEDNAATATLEDSSAGSARSSCLLVPAPQSTEEGGTAQSSESQTESQNVNCPCPNFMQAAGAPSTPSSSNEVDSDGAANGAAEGSEGSAPRQEGISNTSYEESSETAAVDTTCVPPLPRQEQKQESPKPWSLDQFTQLTRKFNLDLAPKLLFSRGPMVELLISSNIARYAEFKAISRILTHYDGMLRQVPCSRADVFGCKEVQLVEKRMLMKFLTFCLEYQKHPEEYRGFEGKPFREFLKSKNLTPSVKHYVLYAIAMCDDDIPTLQGLKATQKFLESLGRYGNSPFLSSLYGSGELPQCFCRLCAVFGGIYHLQRGPSAIICNSTGDCVGMISNGRRFSFKWLVMESSYAPSVFKTSEGLQRVSRAIVITNRSLHPAEKEQVTFLRLPRGDVSSAVVVLELGPGIMVCPNGLFVVHMTCASMNETAEDDLMPAVQLLFNVTSDRDDDKSKPKALYTLFFNCEDTTQQPLNQSVPNGMVLVSSPGSYLDYEHAVHEAKEVFRRMYPDEEFLPRAPDPEDILTEYENNPGDHALRVETEKETQDAQSGGDDVDNGKARSLEESNPNNPLGDS